MSIYDQYLEIHVLMQKYKKKRGNKLVYDYKRACENESLLKGSRFNNKDGRIELAKVIHRVNRAIKRGYIRMINSKGYIRGYIGEKEIFGNIKGKKGYNSLFGEARELIEKGENFESHSRRLQQEYHLPAEIIKDLWNWIPLEEKRIKKYIEDLASTLI